MHARGFMVGLMLMVGGCNAIPSSRPPVSDSPTPVPNTTPSSPSPTDTATPNAETGEPLPTPIAIPEKQEKGTESPPAASPPSQADPLSGKVNQTPSPDK